MLTIGGSATSAAEISYQCIYPVETCFFSFCKQKKVLYNQPIHMIPGFYDTEWISFLNVIMKELFSELFFPKNSNGMK